MNREIFGDRRDAGAVLAARLSHYKERNVVVLALPRGGVPVSYEVARTLNAPLDVFVVRKLGVPGHRELAMGAIAPGGVRVLDQKIITWYGIPEAAVEQPVGAASVCAEFRRIADEVVCVHTPEPFYAVGQWYADFSQTSDSEVRALLHESGPLPRNL